MTQRLRISVQIHGWETGHLRGQDHGHRVVEHALTEEQSIQIHVHLQLVEDGQDGHCEHRQACSSTRVSLNQTMVVISEQRGSRCQEICFSFVPACKALDMMQCFQQ